jgi:hypothetical protein
MSSFRTHIILFTTALTLAACNSQHTGGYPGNKNSEKLLNSSGGTLMAEGGVDPLAAHMAARRQVDPKDINGPHQYTTMPTAEEINKDTNVRIVRLESEVAGLRDDFRKMVPAHKPEAPTIIASLPPEPAVAPPEAIAPEAIAPAAIAPAAGAATSSVRGVRVGEHPDKVRIVLDISGPAKFSYDIDNTEKLLIIDLPQSTWPTGATGSFDGNALVSGYTAKPSASGGVTLAVELKKPAKLTMSSALEPNESYGHRIVFDVAPL